jgi:AcrR family transcriptional regulator
MARGSCSERRCEEGGDMKKSGAASRADTSDEARPGWDERREAIADAALKLFSGVGFENVTNKDLGSAASVAPGLIYYYFKDKDDLFRYVLRKSLRDMLACYAEIKSEVGGEDLNAWIASNISLSPPTSGFLKIMLDYAVSDRRSAETDEAIRQFYASETTILTQSLTGRDDAAQLAILVSVFLDGLMASRIIRPELDIESLTQALLTLLAPRSVLSASEDGSDNAG